MNSSSLAEQKAEWRKKSFSIPDLRGKKETYYDLVVGLINQIDKNENLDLNAVPIIFNLSDLSKWHEYIPFLKGIGLIINHSETYVLSDVGRQFKDDPSKMHLANILQNKIKIFAEIFI